MYTGWFLEGFKSARNSHKESLSSFWPPILLGRMTDCARRLAKLRLSNMLQKKNLPYGTKIPAVDIVKESKTCVLMEACFECVRTSVCMFPLFPENKRKKESNGDLKNACAAPGRVIAKKWLLNKLIHETDGLALPSDQSGTVS